MTCHPLSSRFVRLLSLIALATCIFTFALPAVTAQTAEFTQGSKNSNTMTFEVPLGTYPGRGISLPVTLRYSSQGLWRIGFINSVQVNVGGYLIHRSVAEAIYAEHSTSGWKTSLDVPTIEWPRLNDRYFASGKPYARGYLYPYTYRVANVFIHMPDGSTHELRKADQVYQDNNYVDMSGTFYAVDGSRMRYDSSNETTGTLYLADGTRWIFNSGAVQYIDRNGNTLNYNTATRQWTDTLGRVFSMPWPSNPSAGDYNYQLPGVNGSLTYTLRFKNLSDALTTGSPALAPMGDYNLPIPSASPTNQSGNNFPQPTGTATMFASGYSDSSEEDQTSYTYVVGRGQSGATAFNPVVLTDVILPNGRSYTFSYNNFGELNKVVLPTGGYQRYAYSQVPTIGGASVPFDQGSRGITSQWISPSGNGSDEAQWTYASTVGVLTVTAPNGTRSETYLHNFGAAPTNFGYQDARNGLPYEERIYAPAAEGGAMLRRSLIEYAQSSAGYTRPSPYSGTYTAYRNPRAVKSVSLVLDTGGNALASATTTSYDDTYQFSVGLDATASNEYGFVVVDQTTAQTQPIASMPFGSLVRATQTTYLTSDANYRDRNILGLLSSVTVLNPSNPSEIIAQSTTSYDQSALLSYSSVSGWNDPQTIYRGNVTSTSRWLDYPTPTWITTQAQYDQCGNVRVTTDARGNQSQVAYTDSFSDNVNRNSFAFPTQTTSAVPDPSGTHGTNTPLVASSVYNYNTGLVISTTDANAKTTTFEYNDPLNRQTRVNLPDGGRTTNIFVDAHSCGAYVQTRTLLNSSGAETDSYTFFDGLGRPYRAFTYDNQDTNNPWLTVDTQYDAMGRAWRTSNPYRSSGCTAQINPPGNWTTNTYDALSRVTILTTSADNAQIATAFSAVTTGAYIGPSVTVTDQAGKARKSVSDALGRVIQVIEDPSQLAYETNYKYDGLGNLRRVEQGSQLRFYGYDSLSRVVRVNTVEQTINSNLNWTDPVTGNTGWTMGLSYDPNGNVTSRVDARNISTQYTYDALNRPTVKLYRINGQPDPNTGDVEYLYDNASENGRGRPWITLTWGANAFQTAVGKYDAVGRVKQIHRLFGNGQGGWHPAYTIEATYNLAGNLISQKYPSEHIVNYGYDVAGRLASFDGNLGDGSQRTYASGMSYSPFGGLAQEQFGTQTPLYHKKHYNVRGQLYDVRVSTLSLAQNEFDWNRGCLAFYYGGAAWGQSSASNNGNVTMQQHWAPLNEGSTQYGYTQDTYSYDDRLGRLSSTSEVHGGHWGQSSTDYVQDYDYDRWGNRTIKASTWGAPEPNFGVNTAKNQLTAPAGFAMDYDDAGNLVNDTYTGQGTRTYDAENRMISAATAGTPGSYVYDGDGRRIKRTAGGTSTWQVYGIGGELIAEYAPVAAPSTPRKEYGYRNGELLITAEPGTGSGGGGPSTLSNDLVSHWHLDEASGTRNDVVGTNHLTDVNTVTQAAGKIGSAGQFARANSEYLSVPHNQSFVTGNIDFTLAAWVYLDSNTNQMGVIGKSYADEFFIHHDAGIAPYGLRFNVRMAADNDVHSVGAPTLGTNTWYLVVAWHDAAANTINLQVNNGTVYSAAVPDGGLRTDLADPFEIGRRTDNGLSLDGRVDEASFWKRGLTAAERTELWNGGAGKEPASSGGGSSTLSTNLISNWRLDEASGTRNDVVGTNHLADNNTVTQGTGKIGSAAQFTAANSEFLSIATNSSIHIGDHSRTLAGWFNFDSNNARTGMMGNDELYVYYDANVPAFRIQVWMDADNTLHDMWFPISPTIGAWYYVVIWYDHAALTLNVQINNGAVQTLGGLPAGGTREGFAGSFYLGKEPLIQGGAGTFNGRIDGVSMYDRVLSTAERSELWNNGAGKDPTATGGGSSSSGTVRWLVNDHLGTPRMIIDQSGSQAGVSRHDYLPFGEELYAGVGGRTSGMGYTGADSVRQRFTGYELDPETSLNFAQARYHSPAQGRFTSVDPLGASAHIGNPQSFNRYTYVLNNPVNLVDPDGLMYGEPDTYYVDGMKMSSSGIGLNLLRANAGVLGPLQMTRWNPNSGGPGCGGFDTYRAVGNHAGWFNMYGGSVSIHAILRLEGYGEWHAGYAYYGSKGERWGATGEPSFLSPNLVKNRYKYAYIFAPSAGPWQAEWGVGPVGIGSAHVGGKDFLKVGIGKGRPFASMQVGPEDPDLSNRISLEGSIGWAVIYNLSIVSYDKEGLHGPSGNFAGGTPQIGIQLQGTYCLNCGGGTYTPTNAPADSAIWRLRSAHPSSRIY